MRAEFRQTRASQGQVGEATIPHKRELVLLGSGRDRSEEARRCLSKWFGPCVLPHCSMAPLVCWHRDQHLGLADGEGLSPSLVHGWIDLEKGCRLEMDSGIAAPLLFGHECQSSPEQSFRLCSWPSTLCGERRDLKQKKVRTLPFYTFLYCNR